MGTRTKKRYRLYEFAVLIVCVAIGYALFHHYDRQQQIAVTLEWSRMDPFPSTMHDFTIEKQGNMFTRTFVAKFVAPPADIEAWLQHSPGTAGLQPERNGQMRTYTIRPGGGANHVEVRVDDSTHTVEVYAEWS